MIIGQNIGTATSSALAAIGASTTAKRLAIAYVLFFRLIERVGASRAVTVTFLVPVFGTLWGALFLGESVTVSMLLGGAVVLLGTGLSTGVIRWPAGR